MTGLRDEVEHWPVHESTDLHRDSWVVALRRDTISAPGQPEKRFGRLVLEHPGSVIVLALDDRRRVLCLRQYRHVVGHRLVELPAGLCDVAGESPVEVGRRELLEEAGVRADRWTPLLSVWASPGISDEVQHLVLAEGLHEADRGDHVPQHEEADLEVLWVPVEELLEAVFDGRVRDAPLASALFAWALRHDPLRGAP